MKVATFNVHALSGNRIERVYELIKSQKIDILFLQEISKSSLCQLATKLNYKWYWAKAGFLGNGLVTCNNIIDSQSIKLDIGAQCETRSAIKATIETNSKKIKIVGTHLDHLNESYRLEQIKILSKYLSDVDFLAGDFNSIHLLDYTQQEIDEINKHRDLSGIEHVKGDVIEYIKSLGFKVNPYTFHTSRFQTRIDFIMNKTENKINESIINTIKTRHSDHCLVIAKVE